MKKNKAGKWARAIEIASIIIIAFVLLYISSLYIPNVLGWIALLVLVLIAVYFISRYKSKK